MADSFFFLSKKNLHNSHAYFYNIRSSTHARANSSLKPRYARLHVYFKQGELMPKSMVHNAIREEVHRMITIVENVDYILGYIVRLEDNYLI